MLKALALFSICTPRHDSQNLNSCTVNGCRRMVGWLKYWTLNHEIVGSSPAIH